MPAPRLLDKKLVSASLASQQKKEIDKGVKIAASIDALRETRTKEEQELDEWRVNTIKTIQLEIDAKRVEGVLLKEDIQKLRRERIEAQAPLNLKEEWRKVYEVRDANEEWSNGLANQSIDLLAREEDNQTFSEKLSKEADALQEDRSYTGRLLAEADGKFTKASDALERAEKESQKILENAHQRENHVKVREEDAGLREVNLSERERQVDIHEIDLSNREKKLKSRQETFLKAQKYIKSKK